VTRVRIPANVDRDDTLIAGLTARQIGMIAGPAIMLWTAYSATRSVLPLPVFGIVAMPVAAATIALATGRWHGLPADRFALAALRFTRTPRRLVRAPEGVPGLPAWARHPHASAPQPLRLPTRDIGADGIVDLGEAGSALICTASAVNFALRTEPEQQALVAVFARFLNALDAPVQIVARAERADLTETIRAIEEAALDLPHPALEAAARDHAAFLRELGEQRDLLRRSLLVVFRDRGAPASTSVLLHRRMSDAAATLAAAGIVLTPLDGPAAERLLARAADPNPTARHDCGSDVVIGAAA
jgi:hypothetical protein